MKDDKDDKELAASAKERVVEVERTQFRPLLLSNPNYFGNLKHSAFKAVKKIVSNTTYEELKCVGFNPQLNKLEAVVWILQPSGYSGDICHAGSPEYVRFYLSFDNGATWLDQGMSSFTAYDIPAAQPLEYAVTLTIDPFRRFCKIENLPLVRAILSWNQPPTDPNTPPVWGNILETRIQIDPYSRKLPLSDFIQAAGSSLSAEIASLIDDTTLLELKTSPALSPAALKDLYAKHDVPAHRYLHAELQKAIAFPEATAAFSAKGFLSELELDLSKVIAAYTQINGNTDYEQLECVGFDPDSVTQDALVGTIRIKRPNGYLGNLCHKGSLEYVAFWVDWGSGWEWAGTASVRVHDITNIPKEGLCYAVYQPVNFEKHRKPCEKGVVTARVRAILSWNSPPPPFNPNFPPVWGNRVETRIHLYPGISTPTGDYTPYIQNLCGIAVCNIDQVTGFAPGERPFGASVAIYGHIPGAPNVNTPVANRPRYKITVHKVVPLGGPQAVNDSFPLTLDEQIGAAIPTSTGITQSPDGADFYTYQEAPPVPGVGWRTVTPSRLLAYWNTAGKTGLWEISIEVKDPVTNTPYAAGGTFCVLDGSTRQSVTIDLDQTAPLTSLAITGVKPGGVGPCVPAVNCATFKVGDVICGTYSVSDEHMSGFSLTAEPTAAPSAGFTVDGLNTNGRSYPAIPTTGQVGTWTYNTAGLPPCGYTIQLSSSDRTIVSCGGGWQNNSAFVGFCLVV